MGKTDTPRPPHVRRFAGWVRQRADLKIILPTIIMLALIAYVSALAASPQSGDYIWAIVDKTWWIVLVLTVPYIGARAILWHELLEQLDIRVPWRPTLAALAGGELAKTIPGGIYVQNYILARLEGFGELPVVRSSTATTATLALESALALPVALLVGVPNTPWLPWLLVGIVAVWLAVLVLLRLVVRYWELHLAAWMPVWLCKGLLIADEFLDAGAELATWRTARALVPTAVYMLVYVADLYVIAGAIGVHMITFLQMMGIYAIVVLIVILVPIPAKLGTTELSGLTAFVAYGVPSSTAALIMLGLRLLATGATMLLAAALLLALRREFSAPAPRAEAPGDNLPKAAGERQ
ncbi:MAG TPA: lysylphosphatidylglycerol synthase transmembrane domain-containing protein [Chloroflexota bacterium]|nr:lysylphosphatidylglycerol synthase transmembrane domain-containing protein [Chloroflexota bacterium]